MATNSNVLAAVHLPEAPSPTSEASDPSAGPPTLDLSAAVADALFEIVVAVMWSDGELIADEVERGRAAARAMEVVPQRGGSAYGAIAEGALPFGDIGFDLLEESHRQLALVAAEWVAACNDEPSQRRAAFIRGLQLRLSISDDQARQLRDLATTVSRSASTASDGFHMLAQILLYPPLT